MLVSTDAAPGSRTASWFFEQFPLFYVTSSTAPTTTRLNLRYEAIFGENRDIFAGARVLDLASHDGRWSLAALATGARSVIGIEARPELVKAASENLGEYGYGADCARFVTGDVHEVLNTHDFEADVVLCLGFFYHTLRYNELLDGIRRTNARYLIVDTFSPYMMGPVPSVNVITEDADEEGKLRPIPTPMACRSSSAARISRRSKPWWGRTATGLSGFRTGLACCATTPTRRTATTTRTRSGSRSAASARGRPPHSPPRADGEVKGWPRPQNKHDDGQNR